MSDDSSQSPEAAVQKKTVSSNAVVEAQSLNPPAASAGTGATAALAIAPPPPVFISNTPATTPVTSDPPPQTPSKRKKKGAAAVKAGGDPPPLLPPPPPPVAVKSSPAEVPSPQQQTPGSNVANGRKKSRKQKIDVRDATELSPIPVQTPKTSRRKKSEKSVATTPAASSTSATVPSTETGRNVKGARGKGSRGGNTTKQPQRKASNASTDSNTVTITSYDPRQKIVLRRNEFIDPNLSFTIFPDPSRGLGAIGPGEVVLAVESIRESGTASELLADSGWKKEIKTTCQFSFKLLNLFLSVPHFLPLTSVYSAGEPFSRILRFHALEQYTKGKQLNNQLSTFRFYGPRYEKQVPPLSATQQKDSRVVQLKKKNPNPNQYLESCLIIKHPILGFYSRKLVALKFVVLKKIHLEDSNNTVVGHFKTKVVQLRRSADLKNIEIYVDESRVPEPVSDVNAMNQQNIQPVIHTPAGIVPLIARTSYQQQEYHANHHHHHQQQHSTSAAAHQLQLHHQQQQHQPQSETQFQYVQYHYQSATELAQEIGVAAAANASSIIGSNNNGGVGGSASNSNNFVVNLENATGEYFGTPTFRDEHGGQVLILSPSGDFEAAQVQGGSYIQTQVGGQQQIIQQQPEQQTSYYSNQEQQVIIQQQPQFAPQQQTYTIQQAPQQQQQQIIHIQPSAHEGLKEVQKQIINIPGTNIPLELHFIPSGYNSNVGEPVRSYSIQTSEQPQLQVQLQSPQQQVQYRSGQQILIQQQPGNSAQFQVQPQLVSSPPLNPVVQIRQQSPIHFASQPQQGGSGPAQAQFQYRSVSGQNIVQQQQIPQTVYQGQLNQSTSPTKYLLQSGRAQKDQPQLQQQPIPASLQSPPSQVPGSTNIYHQNQPYPPQTQPLPQQQQQVIFSPQQQNRAPLASAVPPHQALPETPSKKKGKQSSKKQAKEVVNQNFGLTPHQLDQLRQREQQSQPPQAASPATTRTLGPVPTTPQLQAPPSLSSPAAKGARNRTPALPVISSSQSLARFPNVSSGTYPTGQPGAPSVQNPSAPSTSATLASVATASGPPATSPQQLQPQRAHKFVVVRHPSPNSKPVSESPLGGEAALKPVAPPKQPEFQSKPGHLAICPHCGVANKNILRCNRCKRSLPEAVKYIKDGWSVNQGGAAVAVPAPNAITASSATNSAASSTNSIAAGGDNKKIIAPAKGKAVTGRKILVVNKPQAPTPAIQGSSATTTSTAVVVNKIGATPGTVHVQIQPDGGSQVTITAKPAVKRKPPVRRKPADVITLSSDEEEPEPPKTKVAKIEDRATSGNKPAETTASSLLAAAKSNAASTSTGAAAAATATAAVSTKTLTTGESKEKGGDSSENSGSSGVAAEVKQKDSASSISVASANTDSTNMQKQLKVNIDLGSEGKKREENSLKNPTQVFMEFERQLGEIGSRFQYATITCRSVRVGSYKVTTSDTGFDIPVQLSDLGLKFSLPAANYKTKTAKLCIPMESIIEMKAHFARRLQVLFITTGPKYATWIRNALGLDGSPDNESSNYYCPLNGAYSQKSIILLFENAEDSDVGIIKKMYFNVLTEVDYASANDLLMKITPQTYRSCIGFSPATPGNSQPSSAENSPVPRIVSTKSMANMPLPSPAGSSVSGISTASTLLVPRFVPTPANSHVGKPQDAAAQDQDKAILFYEGKNNVKVAISPNDVKCLGFAQFLNDQIIDFWLAVIMAEQMTEDDRQRTFVFDSFFYSKLTEKIKRKTVEDKNLSAGERRHARVRKRTKNVDIFSKDFLIVPINENYHWFIAIICFPGLEGYHDYNTLEALPNHKPTKVRKTEGESSKTSKKKPVVYSQPQNDSTAAYSNRDEAPADPDEILDQISSPDTPAPEATEGKSQGKTESGESATSSSSNSTAASAGEKTGTKRKADGPARAVKHPCILIFDSLAGEARGKVFATLREYLKIELKTKKNVDRIFDKNTMPGCMPKVPQQPNFSDCGLFMLQYVEHFFSSPIPTYETQDMNLRYWFDASHIAENKRRQIYDFIHEKVTKQSPDKVGRIPPVSFEPDENDLNNEDLNCSSQTFSDEDEDEDMMDDSDFEGEEDYEEEEDEDEEHHRGVVSTKTSSSAKAKVNNNKPVSRMDASSASDSDDHNYATSPPKATISTTASSSSSLSSAVPSTSIIKTNLNSVLVAITRLPETSDTTQKK